MNAPVVIRKSSSINTLETAAKELYAQGYRWVATNTIQHHAKTEIVLTFVYMDTQILVEESEAISEAFARGLQAYAETTL